MAVPTIVPFALGMVAAYAIGRVMGIRERTWWERPSWMPETMPQLWPGYGDLLPADTSQPEWSEYFAPLPHAPPSPYPEDPSVAMAAGVIEVLPVSRVQPVFVYGYPYSY